MSDEGQCECGQDHVVTCPVESCEWEQVVKEPAASFLIGPYLDHLLTHLPDDTDLSDLDLMPAHLDRN